MGNCNVPKMTDQFHCSGIFRGTSREVVATGRIPASEVVARFFDWDNECLKQ
jgi:hypothetical protein